MGLAAIQSTRLDERLRRELGPSLLAALDDPDVIEIILNPNGELWLESHGAGMRPAGTKMNAVQAERLIGTVAFALNTVANDQRPVIECELPLDGSRFTGWLPPVVSSPSFVIRKHARLIYRLIVAALIFGVGLHLYTVAIATILGTAGHWALRQAAKFDAQLSEVYIRHLHYQRYYPPRAAITAPPGPVHPAVPRLRKY